MEIHESFAKVVSYAGGAIGTAAEKLPAVPATYRRAVQINNCAPTGSTAEIYVGYDSLTSPSLHVARLFAGGPPVEIKASSDVPIYLIGSTDNVPYTIAEVQ